MDAARRAALHAAGAAALAALAGGCRAERERADAWRFADARTLAVEQGRFGRIEVLERDSTRMLVFADAARGRVLQGAVDLADPGRLVVPYCRTMMLAAAYAARFDEVALIGLGTGAMAAYVARTYAPARLDAIEIDPVVVALARRYFGLPDQTAGLRVTTADGRAVLAAGGRPYDAILIDAYGSDEIPAPLATRQFYEIVRGRLAAGGVYVQNLIGSAPRFASILATIAAVFPTMETYRAGGNWVIVAMPGAALAAAQLVARAAALDARFAPRHRLTEQLALAAAPAAFGSAPVLLDPG